MKVVGERIWKDHKRPVKKNICTITQSLVRKYPKSFQDEIPGIGILGDGLITMTNRITYFIYNKSRQPCNSLRRKLFEVIDSEVDSDNPKKRKRLPGSSFLKDSYGCAKWQPSEFLEGETK